MYSSGRDANSAIGMYDRIESCYFTAQPHRHAFGEVAFFVVSITVNDGTRHICWETSVEGLEIDVFF